MVDLKFSVSMCVYGRDNPEWFELAFLSIINQTLKPNEIILVVDGAIPDDLKMIIDKYRTNELLKIVELKENVGHGRARAAGIKYCTYDLIALMDSDDISVPDRFEKQIQLLTQDSSLDIVGGNIYEFIDSTDNIVGCRNVPQKDFEIKKYMMKRCPFNQVTVMFKKRSVENAGGYLDWYCNEDYYLWVRMVLAKYKFANINENLVFVRVGKEMYQRRGGLKYFKSEAKLQKYMYKNKIIGFQTYFTNIIKRLIVQVILPNKIRSWIFQKFAREQV